MIVDHGIATVVTIHNIGTTKATDVSLTIEFPEEIRVFDIDEVKKLEEPAAPKKPRDLHEIAYERAHKSEMAFNKALSALDQWRDIRPINLPDLNAYAISNSIFESVDIFDNTVSIETKRGIVHTKWDSFSGVYVVPMKKGIFKGKATFMCAEYENPEETEITFVCK